MKSMTGFGRGGAALGNGRIDLELRSLNHRFLDVRTRAPRSLGDLTLEIEQLVRTRFRRGRIEVQIVIEGDTGLRAALDRDLARDAFRSLTEIRDELAPKEPIPLAVLSTVPELFVPVRNGRGAAVSEAVRQAFGEAADRLDEMRSTEGAILAKDIATRLASVRKLAADIRRRSPDVVSRQKARLRERLGRLMDGSPASLDESRLEQEVVLFADRSDVAEELTRIECHCEQLLRLLDVDGEVGRRIEFLLQELGRESNTIGAKSQDADLSYLVIDLKVEIERMREQSQNVE